MPTPPVITPPSGERDRTPFDVVIEVPNPPEEIRMRYTRDLTDPTINHGILVEGATVTIHTVVVPATFKAISILGDQVSEIVAATYTPIPPTPRPPPVPPPRPPPPPGPPPPPPPSPPPPPEPPPPPPNPPPVPPPVQVTRANVLSFKMYYRPDNCPAWVLWKEIPKERFDIIGRAGALETGGVPVARPGFAPRVSLGKPPDACDEVTGRNLRRGYEFQVKIVGLGHLVIDRFRIHAQKLVEKSRATC